MVSASLLTWRVFRSAKKSGLNLRRFPVAKREAFSEISEKVDNLVRYTQIFETFFFRISVPCDLSPGISEIFVQGDSTDFEFPHHFPNLKVQVFLVNCKRPTITGFLL